MSDVTRFIRGLESGGPATSDALFPLVYEELRRLAKARMATERPEHTLQATALVHEVYLRLVNGQDQRLWANRSHFFKAAADAMRRILVDHARHRQTEKRGGQYQRVELAEAVLGVAYRDDELLCLDEALGQLARHHPHAARVAQLRIFAGLSAAETATMLDISPHRGKRMWLFARAWLRREIQSQRDE